VAAEAAAHGPPAVPPSRAGRFRRWFPPAPRPPLGVGLIAAIAAVLTLFAVGPSSPALFAQYFLAAFFLPALLSALATVPFSTAVGGRFTLPRALLLAILSLALVFPFVFVWWVVHFFVAVGPLPTVARVIVLAQGPVLWFRELSLYGLSRPSHFRVLPAALLQPVFALVGLFFVAVPSVGEALAAGIVLLLAFLCAALLLQAADRPLRREFQVSGVALIRPLMDHVATRDPNATRQLEAFFGQHAVEADVRVTMLAFRDGDRTRATVALPTVHPGPFAAVGASDLPRKIDETLGAAAGTVFVPHTPCNHDLDLPDEAELDRIRSALRKVTGELVPSAHDRVSPLVSPRAGSLARAQILGDSVIVLISQAPAPSDDIDYAIIDPLYDRSFGGERLTPAFIDAHNSYEGDAGDLTYGSPAHRQLVRDIEAAIAGAQAAARAGPLRVGTAVRTGYSVGTHGIGAEGIRALVVEGAGSTTAYVLIDGNNLLTGLRQRLLDALVGLVDAAEVMTTDNHVVHEVDGSVNAVGERFEAGALAAEVRAVVTEARAGLGPARTYSGRVDVPSVRVLGPGWTARLLTSLGDTVSVFGPSAVTTFLLMVTSSVIVVALFR
jgi:putative membrane protein